MSEQHTADSDAGRIRFTPEQIDRLGHWLSECLDDAAPLNERVWRSRAAWMVNGPTFQSVMREVVDTCPTPPGVPLYVIPESECMGRGCRPSS